MATHKIEAFMTRSPLTLGEDQTLSAAHETMAKHGIRHLPILRGGKLVGIVSQRDLDFIETLRDVDPDVVTVGEAMTADVYVVSPHVPLRDVAWEMSERKYGSAVVMDGGRVVGVFTTVDALRALAGLLGAN